MDQATAGAAISVAQGLRELNNAVSGLAYIAAFWFAIKTVLSLGAWRADPQRAPARQPATFAFVAAMLAAAPTLLLPMAEKMMREKIQPASSAIAEGPGVSAPNKKASAEQPHASPRQAENAEARSPRAPMATNVEKFETLEQARALADRKALLEVLLGMGAALAIGAVVWVTAKQRRSSKPDQDLPDVQFFEGKQGPVLCQENSGKNEAAHEKGRPS